MRIRAGGRCFLKTLQSRRSRTLSYLAASMRVLDFGRIFDADRPFEEGGVTLVVANWALPSCLPALWRRASFRIAADGGANRLYDELPALFPELSAAEASRAPLSRVDAPRSRRPRCARATCLTWWWATATRCVLTWRPSTKPPAASCSLPRPTRTRRTYTRRWPPRCAARPAAGWWRRGASAGGSTTRSPRCRSSTTPRCRQPTRRSRLSVSRPPPRCCDPERTSWRRGGRWRGPSAGSCRSVRLAPFISFIHPTRVNTHHSIPS